MTEKRFYIECIEYNAWSVWEKGKDVIVFDLYKSDAQLVCDKLNELSDENEQLKQQLKEHKSTLSGQSNKIFQLAKENEYLKRKLGEWVK